MFIGMSSNQNQHSPLARANQAAAAAAAANVALAARRGSYPLSAVAALTAAQQRNLAALTGAPGVVVSSVGTCTLPTSVANVMTGSIRGGQAGPPTSVVQSGNPSIMVSAAPGHQPQHASLTAVAAAQQQLHGLTP